MDAIYLRVFALSLTHDATVWVSEFPYNSIRDELHKVYLEKYFLLSKKLHLKDKLINFVALHAKSVNRSWDRFTEFMKSKPNHHIDDESPKKYLYIGKDDNGKVVLDIITGGSYGANTSIRAS